MVTNCPYPATGRRARPVLTVRRAEIPKRLIDFMSRSDSIVCLEQAEHGSPLYNETITLRDRVLRRPLGLSFSPDDLARESGDIHCAARDRSGRLCGCLVLTPQENGAIRMRQVAVDPELQRSGIGSILVLWSENVARQGGYESMILYARETAVPFYLRLGYRVEGEEFTEVSIPHRIMVRSL